MSDKQGYNAVMQEVCVGRGWCGSIVNDQPSHVDHFIPDNGPVTADQFVKWLFEAEGFDPSDQAKWHSHSDALKDAFIRHMESHMVDASRLKWNLD